MVYLIGTDGAVMYLISSEYRSRGTANEIIRSRWKELIGSYEPISCQLLSAEWLTPVCILLSLSNVVTYLI